MPRIFVIAGEASGDLHAANLIGHLRSECPGVEIHGVGGERVRASGAKDFVDLAHFHVTGFTDALKRVPDYRRAEAEILANVRRAKPDVAVVIDNPGFNLILSRKMRAMGIPVVYYIAPQVWAWAPGRIEKIKADCRKVLVVFEFEKRLYEDRGIPVAFVGHPLKDLIAEKAAAAAPVSGGRRICLLPGSRKGELKMLFGIFLEAAAELKKQLPDVSFSLLKAPSMPAEVYARFLERSRVPVELVETDGYAAIRSSDLAIACSGTATLECALLGTPVVICNRGTLLTYALAKALIRVPYLGLPNLILGEKRFPELLQFDCNPKKIAEESARILETPGVRERMLADLAEVSRRLGPPGASRRAALEILALTQP